MYFKPGMERILEYVLNGHGERVNASGSHPKWHSNLRLRQTRQRSSIQKLRQRESAIGGLIRKNWTRLKAYLSSSTSLPNHSFTDEKTATIFPNYMEELISSRSNEMLYILAKRYRCDLSLRYSTNSSDVLMPPNPTPHFHPHGPEKR